MNGRRLWAAVALVGLGLSAEFSGCAAAPQRRIVWVRPDDGSRCTCDVATCTHMRKVGYCAYCSMLCTEAECANCANHARIKE